MPSPARPQPKCLDRLIVWGGINGVEPPYAIQIVGLAEAPQEVRDEVHMTKEAIDEARGDFYKIKGHAAQIEIQII